MFPLEQPWEQCLRQDQGSGLVSKTLAEKERCQQCWSRKTDRGDRKQQGSWCQVVQCPWKPLCGSVHQSLHHKGRELRASAQFRKTMLHSHNRIFHWQENTHLLIHLLEWNLHQNLFSAKHISVFVINMFTADRLTINTCVWFVRLVCSWLHEQICCQWVSLKQTWTVTLKPDTSTNMLSKICFPTTLNVEWPHISKERHHLSGEQHRGPIRSKIQLHVHARLLLYVCMSESDRSQSRQPLSNHFCCLHLCVFHNEPSNYFLAQSRATQRGWKSDTCETGGCWRAIQSYLSLLAWLTFPSTPQIPCSKTSAAWILL